MQVHLSIYAPQYGCSNFSGTGVPCTTIYMYLPEQHASIVKLVPAKTILHSIISTYYVNYHNICMCVCVCMQHHVLEFSTINYFFMQLLASLSIHLEVCANVTTYTKVVYQSQPFDLCSCIEHEHLLESHTTHHKLKI